MDARDETVLLLGKVKKIESIIMNDKLTEVSFDRLLKNQSRSDLEDTPDEVCIIDDITLDDSFNELGQFTN